MAKRLPKSDAPPADAKIGHNADVEDESNRVQFISIMNKLDAAEVEIEAARAVLKTKQGVRKQVIGLAKAAGIPEWQLKARQEELARPSFENVANVAAENKQRRWLGIVTPEQMEMHLGGGTPEEVRDEHDWKAEGFKAGILNKAATLPEGIPERFVQPYLQGHELGRNDYLLTLAKNVPKPKGKTAQQVAEEAARDFKADNPEVDLDAAAKKLKNSDFMKTGAPEADAPDGDGFEATPDELAAQKPRKAIQEKAAAEEESEGVL